MSDEDREWQRLMDQETECRARCVELDQASPTRTIAKSEAVRAWWTSVGVLLEYFVWAQTHANRSLYPYPLEILQVLARMADDLGAGNIPDFVEDAGERWRGRPLWRDERHALAYAVLYIEAALRDEIADRHPKKTVRDTYGVSAQTVRNWLQRREDLLDGCPRIELSPDILTNRMQSAGKRYASVGRGATSR